VVIQQLLNGLGDEFSQSLAIGGAGPLSDWCRKNGIPVARVLTDRLWMCPIGLVQLIASIRKIRPKVVMLHGQWGGPLGAIAARCAGVRNSIYVAHCPAFYHSTTLWRSIRNYIAEVIPCKLARTIVTLSEGNRYNYLFLGWAGEDKLALIHNGVGGSKAEDGSLRPESKKLRSIQARISEQGAEVNFVCVARLDEQKRVDWLIEAWAQFRRTTKVVAHLWIIGDGPERVRLQQQAKTEILDGSINWVGADPGGREWIASADVVVLSSAYEGHALVPLEAMAAGKSVVAFRVDGIEDSIIHEETGLLSQLGDAQGLAAQMKNLINGDMRKRLGEAGRIRVQQYFTEERMLQGYRKVVFEMLRPET